MAITLKMEWFVIKTHSFVMCLENFYATEINVTFHLQVNNKREKWVTV